MRARDRGAALVEYALIVALLCVGLIGAIQTFQDNAEDRYDERAGQGNPAEEYGSLGPSGGGTTGGTDGSTDGTTDPGVTAIVVQAPTAVASWTSGNKWTMTATVVVLGDGEPLDGVVISAPTWNPSVNGGGGATSCTTNAAGACSWTQTGMKTNGANPDDPTTLTVGTPTYTNPDGSSPTFAGGGSSVMCAMPTTAGTQTC